MCKKTNEPLRVRDPTPSHFILGIIQNVLVKALNQPVPQVADFVRLQLIKSLGMLLIAKPKALIDGDEVYTVRQDEVVPTIWANIAEVVCEEVLFPSRKPESPRRYQSLFTREILYKILDRVERAQEHVKRGVIEHVNETLAWIDLTDHEGASGRRQREVTIHQDDMILPAKEMIITDKTGNQHQAAAAAEGTPTGLGCAMGHNDTMDPHAFRRRNGKW
ncbi:MAG TPA: hypothetical protein VNJ09_03945, partial [Chthonomonadales bacterium]|nr:hypothetical protein [Chthonomonadales bacterium]